MIKKILSPAILVIAIVLGGVGADFLRNKPDAGVAEDIAHKPKKSASHDKADDGHGKKKKKKKKKKGHGADDEDEAESAAAITYMKFKRQFVVPIMSDGKINSLVLLNLNLELGPNAPPSAYTLEPKLRDAIMRELLILSHEGAFSGDLTSMTTYDKLSKALLRACEAVIKDGVNNVLILDLMRQDQ